MADTAAGATSGSDDLWGDQGDDVVYGQMDDTARPATGTVLGTGDTMHGGPDADSLLGDLGVVQPTPATGARRLVSNGSFVQEDVFQPGTLVPVTTVPAALVGVGGSDVAFGDGGNDTIRLGADRDLANGGADDDVVLGGDADDALWGGTGHDRLFGGYGDDHLDLKRPGTGAPSYWATYATVAGAEDTDDKASTTNGADLAYGGWGADTMQADQGGAGRQPGSDQLVDWVGNHNLYLVCNGAYGAGYVQRQSSPDMESLLSTLVTAAGGTDVATAGSAAFYDLGSGHELGQQRELQADRRCAGQLHLRGRRLTLSVGVATVLLMDLGDAYRMGTELLRQHGLDGWTLAFDGAKRRAGVCRYDVRVIGLSAPLTRLHARDEVRETVLHEVAHALVGPRHGHDAVWVAQCPRHRWQRPPLRAVRRPDGDGPVDGGLSRRAHRRAAPAARARAVVRPVQPHVLRRAPAGVDAARPPAVMHPNYLHELEGLRSGRRMRLAGVGQPVRLAGPRAAARPHRARGQARPHQLPRPAARGSLPGPVRRRRPAGLTGRALGRACRDHSATRWSSLSRPLATPVGRACRDHSATGWSSLSRPLSHPVGRACRDHSEARLSPPRHAITRTIPCGQRDSALRRQETVGGHP